MTASGSTARPRRRRDLDRTAGRAFSRAHPPAPAGARRAPALGARVRAPPRREPAHGRRRLRPVAGARPGGSPQAAWLLRARAPPGATGAQQRARDRPGSGPPAAGECDFADPRHVPAHRAPGRCRAWAPCRPIGWTCRCWPARCARCRAAISSVRSRCNTANRRAKCGCAGPWRRNWRTSASARPRNRSSPRSARPTRWTS